MTPNDLATALERSSLSQAADAAQALRQGWLLEVEPAHGPCEANITTYTLRLAHLQRLSPASAHAAQLATSVDEFVVNLRASPTEWYFWCRVSGPEEYFFQVICTSGGRPLGCLRSVSRLEVSPSRWRKLWGEE